MWCVFFFEFIIFFAFVFSYLRLCFLICGCVFSFAVVFSDLWLSSLICACVFSFALSRFCFVLTSQRVDLMENFFIAFGSALKKLEKEIKCKLHLYVVGWKRSANHTSLRYYQTKNTKWNVYHFTKILLYKVIKVNCKLY